MAKTLTELCATLRAVGMQPTIDGEPATPIESVATLEDAGPGQITFLANPKYERLLAATRASAVVVRPELPGPLPCAAIRVSEPYGAITALIVALHGYRKHGRPAPGTQPASIAPTATIGPDCVLHPGVTVDEHARIGARAVLYPGVFVGARCRLGDDVTLYPNVVVYEDCILGNRVAVHSGSVIGEDGLGYAPLGGRWVKIPQIGNVEIGDDVEIGANCAVDRATLGTTRIGRGTKFSNLIAIGHGAHIGEDCMFVAQVGVAGSVTVGHHVTMAGQAGVVGHVRIGDHATVGAKAGVTNNVADGETVLGQPATPISDQRRIMATLPRLPELKAAVRALEKENRMLHERLAAVEALLRDAAGARGPGAPA